MVTLNKLQYVRNGAGKVTSDLFQGWVGNSWVNSSQKTVTYYTNGDMIDQISQNWNGSTWANQSRRHFAYTGAHVDTFTTYTWNNAWINGSRYTYSPAGAADTVTIETWNGTQWQKYQRFARTWSQSLMTSCD